MKKESYDSEYFLYLVFFSIKNPLFIDDKFRALIKILLWK